MASLGNIGNHFRPTVSYMKSCLQFFTINKRGTSVDAFFTGTKASRVPYSFIVLYRNSSYQYKTRSDGNGEFHFFDMEDSGTQIYSAASYTQDGATGEAWTITVVGSTVTITMTFAARRAQAMAFS